MLYSCDGSLCVLHPDHRLDQVLKGYIFKIDLSSIRYNAYSVSDLIPSKIITEPCQGRTPWSGPPAEVCNHGPTWADHPAQAASCAAHACRSYASKGSLDTLFKAVPRLSLMVLLLSRFAAHIPTLCCTNPLCLAVVCMLCWLARVHFGFVLGSSLSARANRRLLRYDA